MKWREQHEEFKKLAIREGIARLEDLKEALPFGCAVPEVRIMRWLGQLLALPKEFASQRRYINRFKLGADPEFIFVDSKRVLRIDARSLELQQGLAFGMDNNGRLTEIRPYPSRSALNIVASILATLRWLAILYPVTLDYEWQAGAFLHGDGIGGHVHFGRKRPHRNLEVKALDTIEEELLQLKAYPLAEVLRRRQGDGRNHPYGLPGDIRFQQHGYEYRTFPSWLDNPELAFVTLVLSKLAVQNPTLTQGFPLLEATAARSQRIWNLLAYYKDIDDDARLALRIVARKFPTHLGGDFKKRWGIEKEGIPAILPKITFIPSCIKPSKTDAEELFNCFLNGKAPTFRVPEPTWTPTNPLKDYVMAIKDTNTWGAKGLGELLWDVVRHKSLIYVVANNRNMDYRYYFSIPKSMATVLPRNWANLTENKITVHAGDDKYIYSNEQRRGNSASFTECRRLLLQTIFPFWRISEVKADSLLQWQRMQVASRKRYSDTLLYGDMSLLDARYL